MEFFRIFMATCLILQVLSVPVKRSADDFCSGEQNLNYESDKSYKYEYETDTDLFVNDISDELKTSLKLTANVVVTPLGECNYFLSVNAARLSGESLGNSDSVVEQLNSNGVVFRMNSEGELDCHVKFAAGEEAWSRNIKRAIVSAFQVKSFSKLRESEQDLSKRSAVVYEKDVLGNCRTTYSAPASGSGQSYTLTKKKALHRCTLSTYQQKKFLGVQFVPYEQTPEFLEGRVFIEDYKCESVIDQGLIQSVDCREISQYKPNSRGIYGVQAHVSQKLSYKGSVNAPSDSDVSGFESVPIAFEYFDSKGNRVESEGFSASAFADQVCANALEAGLANEHAQQFKDLVFSMKDWTAAQMVNFYKASNEKCELAGLTASQAIVMAKTDNSVEAALALIDLDAFKSQKYITEYPVLTALARDAEPSLEFLKKFKSYLSGKSDDFDYYNKLSLVYSTLVNTYCKNNECSVEQKNDFSSVFDSGVAKCSVIALKSVGNIGGFADAKALAACAQKDKSVEQQVVVLESSRNFRCEQFEKVMDGVAAIFTDATRDTEVRIAAFLAIIRCSENSEKVNQFASKFADFLLAEEDQQVISFVIDYGKEHGLTRILNPVLNDPRIRAKFAVNFKELSWNNYKFRQNVLADAAIEAETSVIFTPQTWLPRSIRVNLTTHAFGASVNWVEANLRLEGLDEVLKAVLIEKLTSDEVMKKIMEAPDHFLDILKIVADKLQYKKEAAKLTLSLRVYGSDVFYSLLDSKEKFEKLANFLRSPRETLLYRQVETLKNVFIIDTEVRQPLLNGLSFVRHMDIAASLLLSKKSTKSNIAEGELSYHVNNFWSGSLSFRGIWDVVVNNGNKLSLKKKSFANGRVRLNVDGAKKKGKYEYNLHLSPLETIPLFTADGQFYKLDKNLYQKVTKFKTARTTYTKCNTDTFQATFGGLQLCLSADRPELGSVSKILKFRRAGDLEEDFQAYYEDLSDDGEFEADNKDNTKRPMIFLAGPYHFEIKLNNPELIKTIAFDLEFDRDVEESDIKLEISTLSKSGAQIKRGELVYKREREMTYRGYHGKMNLYLKNLQTNEVRFQFQLASIVHPGKTFKFHFEVENKIVRAFHHKLLINRDTTVDGLVPQWNIEVLHDSSRKGPKRYQMKLDLTPEGRDVRGLFFVEGRDESTKQELFRPIEGRLAFLKQSDNESGFSGYTVEIVGENKLREAKLSVTGHVLAGLLKSDVNLFIDYKNPRIVFPKPANIRLGHIIDGRDGAKSKVFAHVEHSYRGIDHGVVVSFIFDQVQRDWNYLEFELSRPGQEQPASVFFEKTVTDVDNTNTRDIQFGIRNIARQLTSGVLINVDGDSTLRSLIFHHTRVHVKGKSIDRELNVKKNGNSFAVVRSGVSGELNLVRESVDELPKTGFGAHLYVKVLDNSGAVSANLDLEASKAAQKYAGSFKFKTENLFKILSKLASVEAEMSSSPGSFNAQIEYKKLGEVKSFKLQSTSQLRKASAGSEFNVKYEKRLANGDILSGEGTGSFKFDNFKNFELAATIPGHYWSKISAKNTRTASQTGLFGHHDFKLENAHLDYEPSQNRLLLNIEDTRSEPVGKLNLLFDFRAAPLNQLENRESLYVFQQLSTQNTFAQGRLFISKNNLNVKSARFNIDLEKKSNLLMNPRDGTVKYEAATFFKIPALITDPGKLNTLKHTLDVVYNPATQSITATNRFKTDSKLFGRVVRVLDVDFKRSLNASADMINAALAINYNMPSWGTEEVKQWKFDVKHDMHKRSWSENFAKGYTWSHRVQQNRFPEFTSYLILPGETFPITDCTYDEVLQREKASDSYLLDLEAKLVCNSVLIKHEHLIISRSNWQSGYPSFRFQVSGKSDFHPDRLLKFAHDKFSASHGLIGFGVNMDSRKAISNEFFYDRSLSETGEFKASHYRWSTSFGDALSKVCDLNFARTTGVQTDGFITMDCRLNTTKYANKELSYGFNLKSLNFEQRLLGNRNYDIDVYIPGRTFKVVYDRNYPSYFDGNDDDEDSNNEREFNSTVTFYWNYLKEPTKSISVVAKRDNYAHGKSTTFVEFVNTPFFNSLKFKVDKTRTVAETNILFAAEYNMKSGSSNRLTVNGILSSDFDTNRLSVETNLDRPSFNTLYENRFNKWTGKLDYLGIRIGKVLKLSVDKESRQGQRMIALSLVNPDESRFQFEGRSDSKNGVYTVEGSLSESGKRLSNVLSKFDAKNTDFVVLVDGVATGSRYRFNFGVYNETIADASVVDVNTQKVLGKTSASIIRNDNNEHELVVSMRWNRFWRQIISDIQGGKSDGLAAQSSQYNSYFGDVYATVTEDLKPVVAAHRAERKVVAADVNNLAILLADFYSNLLSAEHKAAFDTWSLKQAAEAMREMSEQKSELPVYKKAFRAYNKVAKKLTELSMFVRRMNKNLSKYIPRLPTYEYNEGASGEYQNNLVVRRPTLYAKNLYQFNQEYRDYLRKAGANFLSVKGNLVRSNLGGMSIKALVNKYKYRSLSDYTIVGHVFNKRNMIGFDGESVVLQSRCRYLLAHETKKNEFSVVLNFEKKHRQDFPITIFAYGLHIDLGYDRATVYDAKVALPQRLAAGRVFISRGVESVCVEVKKDLKVCCYDDSKSCTVATTRWYVGRLNGLLGKADNDAGHIKQQDWYLENKCAFPGATSKQSSPEAVQACYSLFGNHKEAVFRDALQTVNPESWRTICESVLTASIKYRCTVIRAFVHQALIEKVHVNIPDDCMYCKSSQNNYAIGQSVPAHAAADGSNLAAGSDVVYVRLPCAKQEKVNMKNVKLHFAEFLKNPENRYYVVVASNEVVSVVQGADGKDYNVDISQIKPSETTEQIDTETFIRAMYTAGSLLTQRLAQHRHIVIESCGNSLPYRLDSFFYLRHLAERNVVVHSIGNYEIKNLDFEDEGSTIFGYGYNKVFLYDSSQKTSDDDSLDNYSIDHTLDLPARLAVKTGGLVLVRSGPFMAFNLDLVKNYPKQFTYNVGTCQRLDSVYGDLTDFKYTRTEVVNSDFSDY